MGIQLEVLKSHLPYGYEKKIAEEVGCCRGTVHNVLNAKKSTERSSFRTKILKSAQQMAEENLQVMNEVAITTANLMKSSHESAS